MHRNVNTFAVGVTIGTVRECSRTRITVSLRADRPQCAHASSRLPRVADCLSDSKQSPDRTPMSLIAHGGPPLPGCTSVVRPDAGNWYRSPN